MKTHKWVFLAILFILLGIYISIRFYLFLKPPSDTFPLSLMWQTNLGQWAYERPAYQNDQVLFSVGGVFESEWYSLEPATGRVVWSQQLPNYSYLRCLNNEYLILSGPNALARLQPTTGNIVWQRDRAWTAVCNETSVFIVVSRGSVLALNLVTGQTLWAETKPREAISGLVFNFKTDQLIGDGAIVVDPLSGKIIHSFEPSFLTYAPTDQGRGPVYLIDEEQLFVGSSVRDAATGRVLHVEERFEGFTAPTITKSTIYIADGGGYPYPSGVAALDRLTFELKWTYKPVHKFPSLQLVTLSPVAIFDGIGYVIFSDATLRAFDLKTGQEIGYWQPKGLDLALWPSCTLPIPRLPNLFKCVHSSGVGMVASDDVLFVSFGDGKLYAFR